MKQCNQHLWEGLCRWIWPIFSERCRGVNIYTTEVVVLFNLIWLCMCSASVKSPKPTLMRPAFKHCILRALLTVSKSNSSMSAWPDSSAPDGICWRQGCDGTIHLLASACPHRRYILYSDEVVGSNWLEGRRHRQIEQRRRWESVREIQTRDEMVRWKKKILVHFIQSCV